MSEAWSTPFSCEIWLQARPSETEGAVVDAANFDSGNQPFLRIQSTEMIKQGFDEATRGDGGLVWMPSLWALGTSEFLFQVPHIIHHDNRILCKCCATRHSQQGALKTLGFRK